MPRVERQRANLNRVIFVKTNMLFTVLAFLVALGILITFHELGHYWVARWCGVKILRFSLGFGKVLLKRVEPVGQHGGHDPSDCINGREPSELPL